MNEDPQNGKKKKKEKNIHDGHRKRIRQKFLDSGFDSFRPHEIVEMLLYYAIPRANTNEIAHELLKKYKTLSGICDADIDELQKIKGMGEHSAIFLKMIPLITKEYLSPKKRFEDLSNGRAACDYFKRQFMGETNEIIRMVCLTDNLKVIASDIIAEGAPGKVSTSIRRIIEITYKNHSENIMIAHNHPIGTAIPSDEDIKSTIKLYNALNNVGIHLLDHILVSNGIAVSFRDSAIFAFNGDDNE